MAVNIGPKVGIDGYADFTRSMKNIINQSKTLAAEMKNVTSSFDVNDRSQEKLTAQMGVLQKQINVQAQQVKLLGAQYAESSQKSDELSKALEKAVQEHGKMSDEARKAATALDNQERAVEEVRRAYLNSQTALNKMNAQMGELRSEATKVKSPMESLEDTIQGQKNELARLEKEYGDMVLAFGKGSSSAERLRGEIRELNGELKANQARMDDAKMSASDLGEEFKEVADDSSDFGGSFSGFGDFLGAGAIIEVAKGIADSIGGIIDETKEYRKIMASLDVSSSAAGYSADETAASYEKLYSVLGDDQTAATATANLQALKLPQEQLAEITNAAIGAWATYGDSIPIDSLSEAINETIKTGNVTGAFADVLNWAGQNEDAFNEKLSSAADEADRANIVLQAMADQGLIKAGEAWQQNNQDIQKANQAQLDFMENSSQLAASFSPLVTAIKEASANALGFLADAFSGVDFGGIVDGETSLQEFSGQLSDAIASVASGLSMNLPSMIQTGTQMVGAVISGIVQAVPQVIASAKSMIETFTAGIAQSFPALIQSGISALAEFTTGLRTDIGGLVDSALTMMKTLADGLIQSLPALIESVPLIVSNIAGIINDNAPKLIATGFDVITNLISGIIDSIPTIIANIPQILMAIADTITAFNWLSLGGTIVKGLSNGIQNLVGTIKDAAGNTVSELVSSLKSGFAQLPKMALSWGKDMISGFIHGITDSIGGIVDAVAGVASSISSYLHFSRPDIGPLRDYENWMPDMMAGMAKGIKQSTWMLKDALDASLSDIHFARDFSCELVAARRICEPVVYRPEVYQPEYGAVGSQGRSITVELGGITINTGGGQDFDIHEISQECSRQIEMNLQRKRAVYA